jgi:hypothetical protein
MKRNMARKRAEDEGEDEEGKDDEDEAEGDF